MQPPPDSWEAPKWGMPGTGVPGNNCRDFKSMERQISKEKLRAVQSYLRLPTAQNAANPQMARSPRVDDCQFAGSQKAVSASITQLGC